MVALLSDKKATTIACLTDHVDSYNTKGFKVTRVGSAGALIGRYGVDYDETVLEQHVSRVEAMIKQVKKKTRSILHGLPYRLPSSLMRFAIQDTVRMVNTMVPKDGLHGTSLLDLFLLRRTDVKRDFRVAFGEYCHIPVHRVRRVLSHTCVFEG